MEEGVGVGKGMGQPTEAEKRKWPKVLIFAHHSVRPLFCVSALSVDYACTDPGSHLHLHTQTRTAQHK